MWMMGYNDGGDLYMGDSFNGRKLRPLVPKPISSASQNGGGNGPGITSPPCLSRLHGGADVFSLNPNHIGMMSDQSKKEFNLQHQVVVSSRWNPTPEQLRTLEELYRHGTRTPSADQIQHITAQLRRYGKIEGKNVFYWFQNHKARERQKRRRQMESDDHQNINDSGQHEIETLGRKDTESAEGASNKTLLEVDHHHHHHHHTNKNATNSNSWAPPMNCSALPEEPATSAMQKAAKAGGGGIERKSSSSSLEHRRRWMKIFGNGESQCRRSATDLWPMMQHHQLSCPPPTHLINTATTDPKLADNNKFPNNPHLTSFLIAHPPPHEEIFINSRLLYTSEGDDEEEEEEDDDDENSQTLQLFPLRSGDGYAANGKEDTEMSVSAINGFVAHPHQFFEFLPVKNQ